MDLPENKLRGYIPDNGKPMWTAHNNHNIRYFKEDEIKIITNDYNTLLGKGAFGEVYKGVLDDSSPVAVKRYIHNIKESFAKEVIVHCEINHRNVVRLIGCCIGEKELMMVTEYISRGNLSDILHCSEIPVSMETRLGIAIDCAEALSYMHSQMYGQVIHGDIKPANILLDENLNAKISDFGISKLLSTDNTLYTTHVIGSIGYMDPLFARSGRLTSKSDVYSFGVVLLELITRRKAVDDGKISLTESFTQALAKRKKIRDFYDVKVSYDNNLRILDGITKVAAKCLAMDIEKRPEMKDVVERLRMLRKAQFESQEKIAFFGWVWRSKQVPQNMIPRDKMDQVLIEEVQAQKAGEVDINEHNITAMREGSPRYHIFSSLQELEFGELLSSSAEILGNWNGKFATTYKVGLKNGTVLVVKRLKTGDDVPEKVFKERIGAIGAIEHELIAPLLRYYLEDEKLLLVYDYFPMGSLSSNLHGITWETRSAIALSAARAVAYIHSTNNATGSHGNINSSNILLTGSYEARVSEHGLKTLVSSPTSITNNYIEQKDDVYSFGIMLLEMLTGKSSTKKLISEEPADLLDWILSVPNDEHWAAQVLDKKLLTENSFVEEMVLFAKLAIHCCEKKPTMRPAMSEVAQQIEEIRGSKAGG